MAETTDRDPGTGDDEVFRELMEELNRREVGASDEIPMDEFNRMTDQEARDMLATLPEGATAESNVDTGETSVGSSGRKKKIPETPKRSGRPKLVRYDFDNEENPLGVGYDPDNPHQGLRADHFDALLKMANERDELIRKEQRGKTAVGEEKIREVTEMMSREKTMVKRYFLGKYLFDGRVINKGKKGDVSFKLYEDVGVDVAGKDDNRKLSITYEGVDIAEVSNVGVYRVKRSTAVSRKAWTDLIKRKNDVINSIKETAFNQINLELQKMGIGYFNEEQMNRLKDEIAQAFNDRITFDDDYVKSEVLWAKNNGWFRTLSEEEVRQLYDDDDPFARYKEIGNEKDRNKYVKDKISGYEKAREFVDGKIKDLEEKIKTGEDDLKTPEYKPLQVGRPEDVENRKNKIRLAEETLKDNRAKLTVYKLSGDNLDLKADRLRVAFNQRVKTPAGLEILNEAVENNEQSLIRRIRRWLWENKLASGGIALTLVSIGVGIYSSTVEHLKGLAASVRKLGNSVHTLAKSTVPILTQILNTISTALSATSTILWMIAENLGKIVIGGLIVYVGVKARGYLWGKRKRTYRPRKKT